MADSQPHLTEKGWRLGFSTGRQELARGAKEIQEKKAERVKIRRYKRIWEGKQVIMWITREQGLKRVDREKVVNLFSAIIHELHAYTDKLGKFLAIRKDKEKFLHSISFEGKSEIGSSQNNKKVEVVIGLMLKMGMGLRIAEGSFDGGSAFPAVSIAQGDKCLWDLSKLVVCGDFCVSPNVEGAIIKGYVKF
ncbi:hypothetical protein Cgig2_010642 [Carnegiea gigantea]|uniref:Uncharacterized protein n=1 Tax=Carnegiea gigantea TaxID=171969 RepID=A0A9Q1JRV5_9CARY|nr:hypothetical protein Cgig2_010642 [Carnegiea gigantea]